MKTKLPYALPSLPSSAFVALFFATSMTTAACSSDDDAVSLPLGDAERARELSFESVPAVERRTQSSYVEEASELTDEQVASYRDYAGRLGFFGNDFDVRKALGGRAALTGAYYSSENETITLFEDAPADTVVHELVHALQDQHFDLDAIDDGAASTDEFLARRALVEGDAELAQLRYIGWSKGADRPEDALSSYLTAAWGRDTGEEVIVESGLPAYFAAYPSFVYFTGSVFVAQHVGVQKLAWSTEGSNAMFRGALPMSSQQVLREAAGLAADPILETGLSKLPESIDARYEVNTSDRLGEWYTYLLLRGTDDVAKVTTLADAWDGDQYLVLRAREGNGAGIVWTTAWDDERAAADFATHLQKLHGAGTVDPGEPRLALASDGENYWLDRKANTVVFVKNLDRTEMQTIGEAALEVVTTTAGPSTSSLKLQTPADTRVWRRLLPPRTRRH